jgi:hypothetical protein
MGETRTDRYIRYIPDYLSPISSSPLSSVVSSAIVFHCPVYVAAIEKYQLCCTAEMIKAGLTFPETNSGIIARGAQYCPRQVPVDLDAPHTSSCTCTVVIQLGVHLTAPFRVSHALLERRGVDFPHSGPSISRSRC